jgi:S-adenosylmethionine decarboxylase
MEYGTFGRHVIADFWGVDFKKINDVDYLKNHLYKAAQKCDATILDMSYKKFDPFGVTIIILLSESHLSIHTYPEQGFAAIDGYTCGKDIDSEDAINYLIAILEPKKVFVVPVILKLSKLSKRIQILIILIIAIRI